MLELTRHERLTDNMSLKFFELPKVPEVVDGSSGLKLWLALFKAETEDDLKELQNIGGEVMVQAVKAYHHISASGEFRELERLRERARMDEANALATARKTTSKKIALNMNAEGFDINVIAKVTGHKVADIQWLLHGPTTEDKKAVERKEGDHSNIQMKESNRLCDLWRIARSMRDHDGMDVDIIAKRTGLTVDDILKL